MRLDDDRNGVSNAALFRDSKDLAADITLFDDQRSDGDRQFKASRPSASRIEVQHSVFRFLFRSVAVAGNHNCKSGGFRFEVELSQIVKHVNQNAVDVDDFGLMQLERPFSFIDISADGGHGRDAGQLLENFWRSDVAGMNDSLHSMERCEDFRSKQSMRIGDDADESGQLSFPD